MVGRGIDTWDECDDDDDDEEEEEEEDECGRGVLIGGDRVLPTSVRERRRLLTQLIGERCGVRGIRMSNGSNLLVGRRGEK